MEHAKLLQLHWSAIFHLKAFAVRLGARQEEERRRMAYWRWRSLIDSRGGVLEAATQRDPVEASGAGGISNFRGGV